MEQEKSESALKELFLKLFKDAPTKFVNESSSRINLTTGDSFSLPSPVDMDHGAPPLKPASIVAIILGIVGLLANVSTLIAISKTRSKLTANLRLILSLCSSDMLVCVSILLKLIHKQSQHTILPTVDICLDHILKGIRMTSHIVSLMNLVGLALDHYFAIVKPLKYPLMMRKRHANLMIISFWIFSGFCGFSDFIIPSRFFSFCDKAKVSNYCEAVECSVYNNEYIMFVVAFLSTFLMIILYTVIFIKINKYQTFQNTFRQNVNKNRRGLITTFVIVATFMFTWLPYCLFDVIVIISNRTNPRNYLHYFKLSRYLEWHFYNLLLLNSFLDPLIYAVRMREIQAGYNNMCPFLFKKFEFRRNVTFSSKSIDKRAHTNRTYVYTKQPSQNESSV